MAKLTPEEIKTIKYAVKPLTPEERAEINAIRFGEPVVVETEAEAPVGEAEVEKPSVIDTTGIPRDALETRARQLGVSVEELTPEQIGEVRASLPISVKPRRRRVSAEPPEPEA